MITKDTPAALPSRYFWHAAVGTDVDVRRFDPSGQTTLASNKNRPAIGFIAGAGSALAYTDSMDKVQWLPVVTPGVYYRADIKKLLGSGNVVAAEVAGNNAVTTTVYKLNLYWEP